MKASNVTKLRATARELLDLKNLRDEFPGHTGYRLRINELAQIMKDLLDDEYSSKPKHTKD